MDVGELAEFAADLLENREFIFKGMENNQRVSLNYNNN
jgi:hypothetical protein